MSNKPLIIWEKWKDPFGSDDTEENQDWNDNKNYADEEDSAVLEAKKSRVIITPMGLIPFSENTDASKIFKFWVAHTNFTISADVVSLIGDVIGVETLDVYTRYRFRVGIGKAFNDREVMSAINNQLYSFIEEK